MFPLFLKGKNRAGRQAKLLFSFFTQIIQDNNLVFKQFLSSNGNTNSRVGTVNQGRWYRVSDNTDFFVTFLLRINESIEICGILLYVLCIFQWTWRRLWTWTKVCYSVLAFKHVLFWRGGEGCVWYALMYYIYICTHWHTHQLFYNDIYDLKLWTSKFFSFYLEI